MTSLLPPVGNLTPQGTQRADSRQWKQAGEEFESLLVTHLLKTAREAGGWLGTGSDRSMDSMMEFAEEQLSKLLVAQGGLGLTRAVMDGLQQTEESLQKSQTPVGTADKGHR